MGQAHTSPPIIVKRFDAQAYVIPRDVKAAVRPPYLRLRDLVVVEHEMSHLIDNVLIDLVSPGRCAGDGRSLARPGRDQGRAWPAKCTPGARRSLHAAHAQRARGSLPRLACALLTACPPPSTINHVPGPL